MVKKIITKVLAYLLGILNTILILIGICQIFLPRLFSIIIAIVIICLSLASGLVIPNPFSVFGLIMGILMLFVPTTIMGIILIAIGVIIASIIPPIAIKLLDYKE